MSSKNLKMFLVLGFMGVTGWSLYTLFNNQKELLLFVHAIKENIKHVQEAKGEVKVVEKVVAQQPWADVQEKAKDAVVQIIAQTAEVDLLQPYRTPQQNGRFGSGFLISENGEIITNAHVADQAQAIWIKIPSLGKAIVDVEVVGIAPERDLALLKISDAGLAHIKQVLGRVPYLKLGDSDLVHRVDEILALGYPLGQSSVKSTSGVVSGREHIGGRSLIQISAAINPGSSGGPAMSLNGEVAGIACSGIVQAQNVGYVIPVNELKMILSDLRVTPLLKRPFLGVLYNAASFEMTEYLKNPLPGGCYVIDVYEGSPLAKAGVKPGDMIYEINGHKIDIYGDLNVPWSEDKLSVVDYVSMLEVGNTVHVVLYRNGKKKEVDFKFDYSQPAPVRKIYPGYEEIEYEIFAGMLIQPLSLNHIPALVQNAPSLARYLKFEEQMKPALVVTHVVPNSQAQRLEVVTEGTVITEINDKKVGTLSELRSALKSALFEKYVRVKTSDGVFFVLSMPKVLEEAPKLAMTYHYSLSSFMQNLIVQRTEKTPRELEGAQVNV